MSLFDEVSRGLTQSGVIGDTFSRNALGVIRRALPPGLANVAGAGINAADALARGNVQGAIGSVIDSGVLAQYLPQLAGGLGNALFLGTPTPLFGGISPIEALRLYQESAAETYARKNLFLIEITSFGLSGPSDVAEQKFNLFATDVGYTPFTVNGDRADVAAASVDLPKNGAPVEVRFTTYDDQAGTLKTWFGRRCAAVVKPDGTVGLPAEYLVKIRIVHSFITADTVLSGAFGIPAYYRPQSLETSLSRGEDGLEEIQMTFTQFDTFQTVV